MTSVSNLNSSCIELELELGFDNSKGVLLLFYGCFSDVLG